MNVVDSIWYQSNEPSHPTLALHLGSGAGTFATYDDVDTMVAAIEAFVQAAGWPWLIVGDLTTITTSSVGIAAINFEIITGFGDSNPTAGQGITFNGQDIHTPGYAPWDDFTSTEAGILALVGNVNVPTS